MYHLVTVIYLNYLHSRQLYIYKNLRITQAVCKIRAMFIFHFDLPKARYEPLEGIPTLLKEAVKLLHNSAFWEIPEIYTSRLSK